MYYVIADHIHLCAIKNGIVVLDLLKDKYQCVRGEGAGLLNQFIDSNGAMLNSEVSAKQEKIIQVLSSKGWVAQAKARQHRLFGESTPCVRELSSIGAEQSHKKLDMARAMWAMLSAHIDLKYRSINLNVTRYKAQKARGIKVQLDLIQAQHLVHTFNYTRPYFPRSKICLFDSYALLKYLAAYSFFPDWIFAIIEMPFAAHCWVQYDDEVLNDSLDIVRPYQPILVV